MITKLRPSSLLVALLFCTGCSLTHKEPEVDLQKIYGGTVQTDTRQINPVIVIPGILGSKLIDPVSNQSIWGIFDNKFLNPNTPQDFPSVALPLHGTGQKTRGIPDGVLSSTRLRVLGIPHQQRAYAGILHTLGAGGFRDQEIPQPSVNWGKEHFTCFQFSYDWRLSNAENAKALHHFILEKKRYIQAQSKKLHGTERPNLKFDIVAHSMGGLLARYYLRYGSQSLPADHDSLPTLNWAGAKHIGRLVMVGTPNSGSILAFNDLLNGQNFIPDWQRTLLGIKIPKFSPALIGTFPSMYELMPRTRHQPVLDLANNQALDLYDPDLWTKQGWGLNNPSQEKFLSPLLPPGSSKEARKKILRNHMQHNLAKARQFHRAIDRPAAPPAGLQISLIAGDAIPTPRQIKIDLTNNKSTDNDYQPGDGVVIRSSTLADERVGQLHKNEIRLKSPIKFQQVIFLPKEHLDLTNGPTFTNNLLYQLLMESR